MTLHQNQSEAELLDDLFVTFARTLLAHMEEWTATEQVPLTHHLRTDFDEDTWPDDPSYVRLVLFREPEEKKDYWAMLYRHGLDPLWKTEEALGCMRCWKALGGGPYSFEPPPNSKLPPNFGNSSVSIDLSTGDYISNELMSNALVTPILGAVDRYKTLHPTQEQLLESLHQFTDVHLAPYIIWDISIPLLDFGSDLQHEEIFGSLRLTPFSVEEKADIWNAFDGARIETRRAMPVHIDDFAGATYHLTYTYTVQRNLYETRDQLVDHLRESNKKRVAAARGEIPPHLTEMGIELNNLITALRLVKSGNVGALGIFERRRTGFPVRNSDLIYVLNNRRRHHYGNAYLLNEADLPAIRRCFDQLQRLHIQSAKSQGELSVAIRRFNQAYERELPEDRIIDLTIALESSLLGDISSKEELNYRFALRGAALLAQTKMWKPEKARALLKAIYSIRSAIVHEGRQLSNLKSDQRNQLVKLEISPDEFPHHCENITRDVLGAYLLRLAKGGSVKTACIDLDRSIMQGLTLTSNEEAEHP